MSKYRLMKQYNENYSSCVTESSSQRSDSAIMQKLMESYLKLACLLSNTLQLRWNSPQSLELSRYIHTTVRVINVIAVLKIILHILCLRHMILSFPLDLKFLSINSQVTLIHWKYNDIDATRTAVHTRYELYPVCIQIYDEGFLNLHWMCKNWEGDWSSMLHTTAEAASFSVSSGFTLS